MRLLLSLISIVFCNIAFSQLPSADKLYQKIFEYYTKNPNRIEYVKNVSKNLLKYDTSHYSFAYVPLNGKDFFFSFLDSSFQFTDGLHYIKDYYILHPDRPEKIKLKPNELPTTMYHWLKHIPAWHCSSLTKFSLWLGKPGSVIKSKTHYVIPTGKYLVAVDTVSYRIEEIVWIEVWEGKTQYNKYYYAELPDSVENNLKNTITEFTNASKDFITTTFRELEKQKPAPEKLEGKKFEFKSLVSMNKGPLDNAIKDKYILFDFFYQACMPCHKMTGYILDWLPKMDSSKIILIGINPADSEYSMKMEILKRKIDYPVIIGEQAKEIAKRYVQSGYPNLLLVSPDGTILRHHHGMSKSFLTNAEKIISQ
jgi:AhpC/TSA family